MSDNTKHTDREKEIYSLYYRHTPEILETIELSRTDDDFRKIYIASGGNKKIVIKHTSNTFTDAAKIQAWANLINHYNDIGIYCPKIIPNRYGELTYSYTENGRSYYIYAEEFAKFETAEHIGIDSLRDEFGRPCYIDDMLCSVGKVSSMHFDFMSFCSAYCLLEPFAPPDTTDESTVCANLFHSFVAQELPQHLPKVDKLMEIFSENQKALRRVYYKLPVSCFQADLGANNVLLDENKHFAGLIDFNLSGKEPVLNYSVRAALRNVYDKRLYTNFNPLFWYYRSLDDLRIQIFLDNLRHIEKYYTYSDMERDAFPLLFRYMNSFWWQHIDEIKRFKSDDDKLISLFNWLECQMTRDDIRLP